MSSRRCAAVFCFDNARAGLATQPQSLERDAPFYDEYDIWQLRGVLGSIKSLLLLL